MHQTNWGLIIYYLWTVPISLGEQPLNSSSYRPNSKDNDLLDSYNMSFLVTLVDSSYALHHISLGWRVGGAPPNMTQSITKVHPSLLTPPHSPPKIQHSDSW